MSALRSRSHRRLLQSLCGTACLLAAGVGPAAHGANPSGEHVVAGQASFQRLGSTLSITQGSEKAIIQWQDFSIGAGELTKFVQPSSTSAVLNRVVGGNISTIYGTLQANGRVFLINPNGILIGPTGVINTAGFVASTLDVTNEEFLAGGDMTFRGPGNNATITNLGSISADGGDLFLIAPNIHNAGTLTARNGTVGLGAGTEVLVKASGEERLFIQPASAPGKVEHSGTIEAATAELKAAGGNEYALAINNSGIVRATAVTNKGGRIFLSATGKGHVVNSGTLQARNGSVGGKIKISAAKVELTATSKVDAAAVTNSATGDAQSTTTTPATDPATTTGGEVHISASEQALVSGNITTASTLGNGGRVVVEAPQITVGAGTLIDASGATGGGTVLVGGGARGADPTVSNAQNVTVLSTATIKADALHSGNAGQVVFWADSTTDFRGSISAQALGATGNGGSVEVSGKQNLLMGGAVNTLSVGGQAGLLLLDPSQMTITNGGPDSTANTISNTFVQGLLATTPTIIFTDGDAGGTDSGNVIVNGAVTWSSNNGLSLFAYNNLSINANVQNTGFAAIVLGGGVNNPLTIPTFGNRNGSVFIGNGTQTAGIAVGSKNGSTTVYGYDLTLQGGIAANSYAQLGFAGSTNSTGTISATLSHSVNLLAGTANGTFAQIGNGGANANGSFSGDINVTAATGDVNLTASTTGSDAYAQIGHGGDNSNFGTVGTYGGAITVKASAGSVILQGGGASRTYAQIGHGGVFADDQSGGSMSGAIQVTGQSGIHLFGGTSDQAYVQIGHGGFDAGYNTGVAFSDDVTATASAGTVTLTGGSASRAYAQIGHGGDFADDHGGSFSGAVNVTGLNGISLSGGTGISAAEAYAQIGHGGYDSGYDGAATFSGDVTATANAGTVTLTGGNASNTYTQIGHGGFFSDYAGGSFSGTINVTGQTGISLSGGTGMNADEAYAQIGHGGYASGYSTAVTFGGDITATASSGKVILSGGTGISTYAHIGHGGDFADFNGGTLGGVIDVAGANGVELHGGGGTNVFETYAQIGHGGLEAGFKAAITFQDKITVTAEAGKVTLTGGNSNDSYAQIGHGGSFTNYVGGSFSGTIDVTGLAGVELLGATGSLSTDGYAQIGHGGFDAGLTGPVTFADKITVTANAGKVTITGGDTSDSYAQIGHGGYAAGEFASSNTGSFTGAIDVTGHDGVAVVGGVNNYAQIGHGGYDAGIMSTPTLGGDIHVTSVAGALVLTGGTGTNSYAQVGHGGESGHGTVSGSVTIDVAQLDLVGGSAASDYAQIGHGAVDSYIASTIQGDVIVHVAGETSLVQGSGGLWWIGHDGAGGTSNANVLLQTGTLDYSTAATSSQTELNFDFRSNMVADLRGGDVTVISTNTTAGATGGMLLSGAGLTADSAHALNFLSAADITVDGTFRNSGTGAMNLVAGWDGTTGLTGTIFDPSSLLAADVATTTSYGHNGGSVIVGSGAQAAAISIGSRQGATNVFAADVNVNGGASNATAAQIGYIVIGFTDPITGAINVRATGDVSLQAGTGASSYALIGHGGTSNNAPVGGDISLLAGGDLTLAGNATAAAQVGHLTQAAGGYTTGNTFIGVGQGASQTGTLTADSFSSFASGSGGQLRFYLPDFASDQIAMGASLNGDAALDPATIPMPNYMGVFSYDSGPYTPTSGNYAFYLLTAAPEPAVPPSSSPGQSPIVFRNRDGSETIIPLDEAFFLLTRFESADDRRFLKDWYQGLFWPGITTQQGDLQYGDGGTPPRKRRHIMLEMSSTQVFGNAAGGQH